MIIKRSLTPAVLNQVVRLLVVRLLSHSRYNIKSIASCITNRPSITSSSQAEDIAWLVHVRSLICYHLAIDLEGCRAFLSTVGLLTMAKASNSVGDFDIYNAQIGEDFIHFMEGYDRSFPLS